MKFGSLFSGIGGFDIGFERAGLIPSWQVEIDKDCNRVLLRHWPNVERFQDVRTVNELSGVDVLCGGFPCQDLSVAGKRAGLAGERSGLWFEFLRIAEINKPRFIVIENVPGLLSSDEGRDFALILRGLVELDYCIASRVLDAQYYGVAQRRRRVFIVGSLGNGSCAQILFESESVSWNPPARGEAGQGIARAVADSLTSNYGKQCDSTNRNGGPVNLCLTPWDAQTKRIHSAEGHAPALASSNGQGGQRVPYVAAARMTAFGEYVDDGTASSLKQRDFKDATDLVVTHALRSEGADASEDGTGRGTPIIPIDMRQASRGEKMTNNRPNGSSGGPPGTGIGNDGDPSPTIADSHVPAIFAFSSKDHGADAGEISPTLRSQNFKDSHINGGGQVAIAFHENKSGQLSEADVLGLRSGASHSYQGVGGQFGVRRLTPRECERLQGFPDDWTRYDAQGKEVSDSGRYRMLGNAVCVNVAEWIGRRILEASSVEGK